MINAQIAQRLGIKRGTVDQYTSRLVRAGVLERRKASTQEKLVDQNDRIIALRKQNVPLREIARIIGTSYYNVRSTLYRLRKQGRL